MKYSISTTIIRKALKPDTKGANAVLFVNRGTSVAIVCGERLEQNQSLSNIGLQGEIDTTLYDVSFVNDGTKENLLVMRIKKYVTQ
jgi:hypothetical protein